MVAPTKISLVITCLVYLVGCTRPLSMAYVPQSVTQGKSDLNVGTFRYLPAENNKVAPNQIENTAVGSMLLDKDVNEYVKRAFALEMDRSGFLSIAPRSIINCDIIRFKADDLGYSVDWYFDLTCRFIDSATKAEVAKESVNITKMKMAKFGGLENIQRAMNNIIFEAYERIFASPVVRQILEPRISRRYRMLERSNTSEGVPKIDTGWTAENREWWSWASMTN